MALPEPENRMEGRPFYPAEPDVRPVIPREPAGAADNRSLGDLFSELTHETRTLIRQEIELARTELTEKASKASRNAAYIGAGGAVAYIGINLLAFSLAFLLGSFMPVWLGFLIAGVIIALAGYLMAKKGIETLKKADFSLERTSESLKEDKQWIKEEIK